MGIERDGYEIIRNAVSAADIDSLRSVLDDAYNTHKPHEVSRWIKVEAVDSRKLREVMDHLYRLVAKPFGVICEGHSFLKRIDPAEYATAKIQWHRDADAAGTDPLGDCLNIWVPLDDVGTDCPSLEFVEGSHITMQTIPTTLPKNGVFETIDDAYISRVLPECRIVTPRLNTGDVVIFDHHLLHRTQLISGNVRTRRSFECRSAFGFQLYMKNLARKAIHQS